MEAEEPMEHSPEHVEETNKDDEAIDVDDPLIPDRSSSSGPQSDYGYDEDITKSQESMITDERVIELDEHDASGDSESDSEESPESPPAQPAFPIEQEFPIVHEEQPLNIRSPDYSQEYAEAEGSSPHGDENFYGTPLPETPSSPQETPDSAQGTLGNTQETSVSPQETPCSPQEMPGCTIEMPGSPKDIPGSPRGAADSPHDPSLCSSSKENVLSEKGSTDPEVSNTDAELEFAKELVGGFGSEQDGSVLGKQPNQSHGIGVDDTPAFPEPSVVKKEATPLSPQHEQQHADSTVDQEWTDATVCQVPIKEEKPFADSSVHISPAQSPSCREPTSEMEAEQTVKDEDASEGECDDSKEEEDEDIYSLDLMEDIVRKEDGVCDSAATFASNHGNREAAARDSSHSADSLRDSDGSFHDTRHYVTQGDADSKVSQSIEKPQMFSETDDSVPVVHSSVITTPANVSAEPSHDVSGSSEVSQSSTDPDSNVHSTSIPSGRGRYDNLRKTSIESVDSDSVRKFSDSGETHEPGDIPNGLGVSPETREGDVRAGKVQANTSFNEEHVELDYDEEEGDDMHGHASEAKEAGEEDDKQKDGSGDEKQDGELSSSDEDKDDGELDDDEDCEEGEIREPGGRKPFVKPICRFYTKGNCTWGNNCRFLHPGVNDKGNYRLFESPGLNGGIVGLNRRFGQGWGQEPGAEPELPPPPPEPPATESAWERGLRHAKEMRKKANMRKEQETNFEEKRMNLSLDEERDLNKENERSKFVKDPYYDQFDDDEYYGKSQIHGWQAGSYENFEVRWTREPDYPPYRHEKERERFKERRYSPPVERMERIDRLERQMFDQPPRTRDERRDKYRDDRMEPPPPSSQAPRGRADEWHDPWQRSKSPKQKRRSRSHSRGRRRRSRRSYSVSSHSSSSYSSSRSRSSSFSSRSSRSSYSRSSSFSSRSPSPRPGPKRNGPPPPEKKQVPPPKPGIGKRGPSTDERKVPPQSRNNNGRRGPASDERKMPPQSRNNDQPRSAVTVKPKQRSPEKRPPGHAGPPGKGGRLGPPGDDRGRRREKPPHVPHPRAKPHSGSRSSSGSSFSRSHSRSSSSSSFSRSGSASSVSSRSKSRSRSRSSSTSSSGSADSEHLYRDLPGGGGGGGPRTASPKKKVPSKDKRPDKGPPKHGPPRHRRRDVDRDRRDDRPRQDSRSGMRGKGPPHGRQPTTPVKPKDPLKLVGQKSNIKLTLLNKPAEKPSLIPGAPPTKRRPSDISGAPPAKRQALLSPPAAKPPAGDKPKVISRPEKAKSPPPKDKPISPTKAPSKPPLSAAKAPVGGKGAPVPGITHPIPPPPAPAAKQKKSMSSRREELLKQLKAVEDAIARKKAKMQ